MLLVSTNTVELSTVVKRLLIQKHVIVHGAPGTGKSFIGQRTVLYSLSQGLRTISTSLMAARANAIGGIHLHRLFSWSSQQNFSHPYRCAELAMEKTRNRKTILHILLTVDVMFLDEAGQVSAEQLITIDIILRELRRSQIPFGGVLLLGTMDHCQLQPINMLPFLMCSLITTSFTMVQLNESVRAATDPLFHEFQIPTRANPFALRNDSAMKDRFFIWLTIFSNMLMIGLIRRSLQR